MEIISNLDEYIPPWESCVLTMGDFDGIHRGHRRLIEETIQQAKKAEIASVLLTYDPSPKKALKKLTYDNNIYIQAEKIALLQSFPLRAVIFLPFDKEIAQTTASKFLKNILLKQLKAKMIIIGYDHKFGRNRHGTYKYLKTAQKKYNFRVKKIKAVKIFREITSSSFLRNLLRNGQIEEANELLLTPYFIQSTVILGKQRGKYLGIPTANLHIPSGKIIPGKGVYFCVAKFGDELFTAVVNIGNNPTFENIHLSVEAHLLGFDKNIYGEQLTLFFIRKIRDEEKFSSVEGLKQQIKMDISEAINLADNFFKKQRKGKKGYQLPSIK